MAAGDVEVTDQFIEWFTGLTEDQQEAVTDRVDLLAEHGPNLGRPTVDTIKSSRHSNMKELRASKGGNLRALFTFDPRRTAILLLGGDKTGQWKEWYRQAIPQAGDLYDEHLAALEQEGLLP